MHKTPVLQLVPPSIQREASSTLTLTIDADGLITHQIDVLNAHIETLTDALLILLRKIRSGSQAKISDARLTEAVHE
ncbi:hypothetical protein [Paraburkholderia saeva]|uniref:hypothetical protein n=1 Tax=Paraburkholderia saeva TaxID=2777537 RepID=UPI001DD51C63|nr:hypothetical protein [Paraburkholderia saeva]CAG4908350.1 hypothetical protein R52603_03619 [Paraburkholderia saeva]